MNKLIYALLVELIFREPDRLFESRHDPEDYDGYENPHNDERISIRSPNR